MVCEEVGGRPAEPGVRRFPDLGGDDMSWTYKLGVRLVVALLLLLCLMPAALGQSRRYMGLKDYLPYTRNLPS